MSANVTELPTQQERMLRAARAYIERGWAVFPLHTLVNGQCSCGTVDCVDAGKHPRNQKGVKEATKHAAQIDAWFGPDAPPANVGVATGNVSGITILDIDIGPGKAGAETWTELTREHGEPQTLHATTGSGGSHFVFAYNSVLKTSSNTLGSGVDCRNDGGYVVAAPSLHRSGGVYKWTDWRAPIEPLPAHLAEKKRIERRGRPKKDDLTRRKYGLEDVRGMLAAIDATDRDDWRHFGIILGREFERADEAWEMYQEWADSAGGKKGRNHDAIMREAFYELSQKDPEGGAERTIGTIVRAAIEGGWAPVDGGMPKEQFVYFGPGNNFIYRPTGSHWQAAAVDAACSPVNDAGKIMKPSEWIKKNVLASSMTSAPEFDEDYIAGSDFRNGAMVESAGAALYNTYRKPTIQGGTAALAEPFLAHVRRVFPGGSPREGDPCDADQFLRYMAHRVQKPWEKPRFALLIAGEMGTGKDTAFEFCIPAIGAWNVYNIAPAALEQGFNEHLASTVVRLSEAANLQEMNKWAFNERTKTMIAGNPDIESINPKYGQKYSVRLYCGVVVTTNHLADGIYIPPGDRRYDVIQSATLAEMGLSDEDTKRKYFEDLWGWFNSQQGAKHIAAYLRELDISEFRASTGQRKTKAHQETIQIGTEPDEWLRDILEELGNKKLIRLDWVMDAAVNAGMPLKEVHARIRKAMSRTPYVRLASQLDDGRWRINGKKRHVWRHTGLTAPTQEDWDALCNDQF